LHGITDQPLRRLIAWGDHLKVDQPQIDAQHKAIFDIALEISDIWQRHGEVGELRAVAEKLGKVLEAHFHYEEQQLALIGYPKLAEHSDEHRVMLNELEALRERLNGMRPGPIHSEPGFVVLSYILGVTVGHISHSDMDYCVFARQAARAKK
jgi:hemerythrin